MGAHDSGFSFGRAKPIRILIAEDNPYDVRLLQRLLQGAKGANFEFRCVERLAEAISLIRSDWPEVLLLDLSLQDSHGPETIERARAAGPELPIIVLTGLPQVELKDVPFLAGVQDYLVKGEMNAQVLLRALRYAIQSIELASSLRQREADLLALQSLVGVTAFRLNRQGEIRPLVENTGSKKEVAPHVIRGLMACFAGGLEEGAQAVVHVSDTSVRVLRTSQNELFVGLIA